MSRKIKIGGDNSEAKKSILDLAKTVSKDLGKSKIELFSPETKKLLRGEAVAQTEALKRQIDAVKESTRKHNKALQDVVKGSKEELKIKEKILKASKHIALLEKDRSKTSEFAEGLQKPGFMSGLGKGLSKIPGIGRLAGLGGMGMLGGAGLLMGGGALAAGAYGVSRVMAGRQTFSEGVDTRLKLRGRQVDDMMPSNTQSTTSAGYNSLTLRQARLRDIDVFGRAGASQQSVIQRGQFERNFGLDEGTMSGIGAAMRPNLGGKGANLTVMKLQASLISSGITDAIGPYLETAAQMLTELNERGFTMDESVTSLFTQMLKTGMGEGRASQLALGVDQGIRGSTGESNAFFQSVFNKAGIGGGTIGGAQAGMRMGGLFGTDLSKYKGMSGMDKNMFQQLGIGGSNHMKNVAGSTLGSLDQMFGSPSEIQKMLKSGNSQTRQGGAMKRLSRLRYVMQAYGLKDEGQAAEVEGLLKQAMKAAPDEQKKIMQRVQNMKDKTPELENLTKLNTSNEAILNILQNEKTTLEDAIGEATAKAFNVTNEILNSIDKGILAIARWFGYSPEDGGSKDKKTADWEEAAKNSTVMERFRMMFDESLRVPKRTSDVARADIAPVMTPMKPQDDIMASILGKPKNQPMYSSPMPDAQKDVVKHLKDIASSSKTTAKNSKDKGSIKPASMSTSGN